LKIFDKLPLASASGQVKIRKQALAEKENLTQILSAVAKALKDD